MNFVEYLIARAKFSGLAGGVQGDIQALRVIENGTFEAPAGTAGYNPVVVNVLDPETGSPLKFTSGSFTPTENRVRRTIEHGLGCMPDFVMVYQVGIADYSTMEEFCEDLPILFAWGFKSSFNAGFLTGLNVPGWGFTQKQYGIDNVPEESQDSGYIYCPDESTFQVGMVSTSETGSIGLASGATYNWIAVAGLGTVSEPVVEPLAITENGTYAAPEGVDGYNPVTVNVPAPEIKLQDKTITENGEYTADSGFDGLGKVLVEIAGVSGGNFKFRKGYSKPTSSSSATFNHYCGVVPDVIIIVPNDFSTNYFTWAIGFSKAMIEKTSGDLVSTVSVKLSNASTSPTDSNGFDAEEVGESYADRGGIRDVNKTTFTFGGTNGKLNTSTYYHYYILYGLTESE